MFLPLFLCHRPSGQITTLTSFSWFVCLLACLFLLLLMSRSPHSILLGFSVLHHLHNKFSILRLGWFLFSSLDPDWHTAPDPCWFCGGLLHQLHVSSFGCHALMPFNCSHKRDTESGFRKNPGELPASAQPAGPGTFLQSCAPR